jgi:hypothetical protein
MILPAEGLGALVKSSPGSFFTMSKPFFFLSRLQIFSPRGKPKKNQPL